MELMLELDLPRTDARFGWRDIADAPHDGSTVTLWIEDGALGGHALENCFWFEGGLAPDWYHRGHDGRPGRLACGYDHHAAFWLEAGEGAAHPPGLSVRHSFEVERPPTWPPGMRERFRRYRFAFAEETMPFSLFDVLESGHA